MTGRHATDLRAVLAALAAALAAVTGGALYAVSAWAVDPVALPAVVVAGALAAMAVLRPALGIAGALLAVAAEVFTLPLPSGALSPAELGIALVGLGYAGRLALLPHTVVRPTVRDLPLAVLLGAIAAGLLVAREPAPVLRVLLLWTTFVLAFLQVRGFGPRDVRTVVASFAVGAGVLGAIGTYEYLTTGGPRLYGGGEATGVRAVGTLNDANYFASLLLLAVVPGLALGLGALRRFAWLLAPVALGVAGIAFSLSRGGLLGLGGGLLVLLLWRRARRLAVVVLAVVAALTALDLNPLVRNQQLQVVEQRLSTLDEQSQTSLRPRIWSAAIESTVERPLVGVGVNNFRTISSEEGVTEWGKPLENAHSIPISLAAETGLLGLGAFLAFLAVVLRDALVAGRRLADERTRAVRAGLTAGLIGFLLQGLTVVQLRAQVVAGAFFVVCGLLAALSRPPEPD